MKWKPRSVGLAALLCLMAAGAAAQQRKQTDIEYLESLKIPDPATAPHTLKGRAAVETMYGEHFRVKTEDGEFSMTFLRGDKVLFRVSSTGKELTGTFRDGDNADTVCVTLPGEKESCNRIELINGKVMMTDRTDGRRFEGTFYGKFLTPPAPPARTALNSEERKQCQPLWQIIETARRGDFNPLVDKSRQGIQPELDFMEPVMFSRLKMGHGCLISLSHNEVKYSDHRCIRNSEPNEESGTDYYRTVLGYVAKCLPDALKNAQIQKDPSVNLLKQKVAHSIFPLGENLAIYVWLGSANICRDYAFPNCTEKFGVSLRVRAKAIAGLDHHGHEKLALEAVKKALETGRKK